MADTKDSGLDVITVLELLDRFRVLDAPAGVPSSKTITYQNFLNNMALLDANATPAAADTIITLDSGVAKETTIAQAVGYLAADAGDTYQATGANAMAKLALGTKGQKQVVNAGATALEYEDAVQLKAKSTTRVTVGNTATETTILTYTVPANMLGAGGTAVNFRIYGTYKNNSGGALNLTIRLKYDGEEVAEAMEASLADNAAAWPLDIHGFLSGNGGAGAQKGSLSFDVKKGSYNGDGQYGTASKDSTGALDLTVTLEHEAADADTIATMEFYKVEIT